jgi:hypothetical protein
MIRKLIPFLIALALSLGLGLFQPATANLQSNKVVVANASNLIRPERSIEVGLHVENIYNLSLKDKLFFAEGWYWLKWPAKIQELIEENKINIIDLVELVNQVETWDSNIQLDSEKPELYPSGEYLQLFRFSAKFYDDGQNLQRFPFQSLDLPIIIETKPTVFSMADEAIILNPKLGAKQLIGQYATLNGYTIQKGAFKNVIHQYNTNFGENNGARGGEFSRIEYFINYTTEFWPAFYQYIMPWIAVMAILLLAPNLEGKFTELRLAIPSTALLTLVFLQLGTNADLPKLSYLTFIDKLYLFGYLASIVLFALFVWGTNYYERCEESQRGAAMLKINKFDLIYQVSLVVGSLLIALSSFL